MIDTIKLKVYPTELVEDHYTRIPDKLTRKRIITNEEGNKTMRGFIKNMNITLDYRGLWIEGSLPKYYYGTNQKTLSFTDIKKAICCLEEEVELNLSEARVIRVDIGDNIITKYPVECYYPILMHCNQFKRNELDNGLGFSNTNRYISVYGKLQEVEKGKELPEELFVGRNVLRYEHKHLSNASISSCLGIKNINLCSMLNNYRKLVEDWYCTFESIRKRHDVMDFDFDLFKHKGMFEKYLKIKGIEAFGGMGQVVDAVNSAKAQGLLKRYANQGTNIIKRLQDNYSLSLLSNKSHLAEELRSKVYSKKIAALADFSSN